MMKMTILVKPKYEYYTDKHSLTRAITIFPTLNHEPIIRLITQLSMILRQSVSSILRYLCIKDFPDLGTKGFPSRQDCLIMQNRL
jgi:hypothetical protein